MERLLINLSSLTMSAHKNAVGKLVGNIFA